MSVQPTTPAPEAPAADAPMLTPPATEPVATAPETPPWGEDFNPERAWKTIQNLREREKELSKHSLTPEQKAKLAEYDKVLESQKTAEQKAQDAAAAAEKRAEALVARAVKAEVKALAEGFADPEDAGAFLDLSKYATSDGDVDTEAIKTDLADLLARKPHLGKLPESRVPAPNPAQGSSGSGASGASQVTEAELDRMTPDQIEKARKEGRLNHLLGIGNS